MHIQLNNRPETFDGFQQLTVQQLLEEKNFSYKLLLVRLNDATIKTEDYNSTWIKDGDNVAVIHFMAGG